MASFEKSIDVDVPVAEAYMLFSDFEHFPTFMEGIERVERIGPDKLHWKAEIAGREEEWDARITEQMPSTKIAWESTSGARNMGTVTFEKLDQDTTRVNLHIEYDPQGFVENVGAMLGIVNGRMAGDLERFKELVEAGGAARGGWHDSAGTQREVTADEADDLDEVKAQDLMDGGQRRHPDTSREVREANEQRDRQAADRHDTTAGGINDRMYSGTDLSDVEQRGNEYLHDERDGMGRHAHDATTGADDRGGVMNRGTERLRDGMNSGYDDVNDTVGYGNDSVRSGVERASDDVRGGVNDLGGTLGQGVNNARDTLGTGVDNARNSVRRTVDDAVDRLDDDVDTRTDATDRTGPSGRVDRNDELRNKRR